MHILSDSKTRAWTSALHVLQIEQQEMQAEIERMEREKELDKAREAERQKKLDEAAAKQRAREKEIEEREVSVACCITAFHMVSLWKILVIILTNTFQLMMS